MLSRSTGRMAILVVGLLAFSAQAQTSQEAKAEARKHYQRALEFAQEGAYKEAVVEFSRAYEIAPNYAVLYNLGQAYIALSRPVEAFDALQRYLAEGGSKVAAPRRTEVEAELKRQQVRIAFLVVDSNLPGAAVFLDGVAVGKTPLPGPLRVAIGEHHVALVLDGYRRAEQSITVAGEESRQMLLPLEALPPPPSAERLLPQPAPPPMQAAAAQPAPPTPAQPARVGRTQRMVGYLLGATGLAVEGAALGILIWNKGRYDDYQKRTTPDEPLASSIRTMSSVNVAFAIGGGVLLAAGIVVVVTAPSSAKTAAGTHAMGIGPGTAAYRFTW